MIFLLWIIISFHGFFVCSAGPIYAKCAPVGSPLSIQCDQWTIIYVRQTMYSEYYMVPNGDCYIPPYNSMCHTFSNQSDMVYNGKHKGYHTFASLRLTSVGKVYGTNCNASSSAKVVQILYECLTEPERPSICDNSERYGEVSGMIFNPGFPAPVRIRHEKCSCRISSPDLGLVKLTAVLINPVVSDSVGKWSLSIKLSNDLPYIMDQMYRLSTDISIPDTNSLEIEYSSNGDSAYLAAMIPTVPTGFWIRYSVYPLSSRLNIFCSKQDTEQKSVLSTGMIAIICGLSGVILLFAMVLVYFLIRIKIKGRNPELRDKRGHINRYHSTESLTSRGENWKHMTFSELNKEFEFLRRCNTISTISRYNSLPPNFVFKKNKKRDKAKEESQNSDTSRTDVVDIQRNMSFQIAMEKVPSHETTNDQVRKKDVTKDSHCVLKGDNCSQELMIDGILNTQMTGIFNCVDILGATNDEIDV